MTKVFLQYPWKFPDSPYYKYLIQSPPESVEYLNTENQKGAGINKNRNRILNSFKKQARKIIGFFRLPIPNLHLTKTNEKYDLIHCAHCLSRNKSPWVADFEGIWQFFISGRETFLGRRIINKILKNKNCKKIIAWTEETKKEFLRIFPEMEKKVEVVYPSVPIQNTKTKNGKEVTILFIGRYFYEKGGHHALKIMDDMTKKHPNVKGIIVSDIPEGIKEKYSSNDKIEFFGLMPQKELFTNIYPKADLFLYPGYSDTFGFAILEAMSFGLPIVTVDASSRKELVENEKTGFVIEANHKRYWERDYVKIDEEDRILKELFQNTERLVKDSKLRKEMSAKCIANIKSGKFSHKERNKKLRKIYEEALRS